MVESECKKWSCTSSGQVISAQPTIAKNSHQPARQGKSCWIILKSQLWSCVQNTTTTSTILIALPKGFGVSLKEMGLSGLTDQVLWNQFQLTASSHSFMKGSKLPVVLEITPHTSRHFPTATFLQKVLKWPFMHARSGRSRCVISPYDVSFLVLPKEDPGYV